MLAAAGLIASVAPPAAQASIPWAQADYEAEWRFSSESRIVTVRYAAGLRKLRFELNDPARTALVKDLVSGRVLVFTGTGEAGAREGRSQPFALPPAAPTGETLSIGGEVCAIHRFEAARLCVTADGVLMQVRAGDQEITALRVIRKPQDAALFAPAGNGPVTPLPGGAAGGVPLLPF